MKKELIINRTINKLTLHNFKEVLNFELDYIQDSSMCFALTSDNIRDCLLHDCSYGVFENSNLIAYCLATYNNYGVGFIKKIFVHPEHRGNKLSACLLKKSLDLLKEFKVTDIYAMISPKNNSSIFILESKGFKKYSSRIVAGNDRIIFKNNL